MTQPFVMVAPTGARRTKADHPTLPISTQEIVETAHACRMAGAQGLHLHVRDNEDLHSLDAGRYNEALSELANVVPDMRIQITTEAADVFDVAAQLACLKQVRPDWASISVREIARTPELADHVYGTCHEGGTEVQHILYNTDDIALLRDWQDQGIVRPEQTSVIFVLGRYTAGQVSAPSDLSLFLNAHPEDRQWMLCAFGPQEHACLAGAARLGGDIRVGFENSLLNARDVPHTDNAASTKALFQLMERIAA